MSRPRPHSAPLAPRRSPLGADSAGGAGLPLRHPALLATLLVVAACIVASGSFRFFEPDMWQHLLVGKVIWTTHSIPHTQLWTWPTHGAPDVQADRVHPEAEGVRRPARSLALHQGRMAP